MHARSRRYPSAATHMPCLPVLLLLAALLPGSGEAAEVRASVTAFGAPDVNAFDLHIAAKDLRLDYDDSGGRETLHLRSIGIGLYESLSDNSRIGVRLGRTGFDQSGRPATAGRDPTGYYAELMFDAMWPDDTRIRAALDGSWRYTSVEEQDDAGSVELDWQTIELRPAIWMALDQRVVVRIGASAIAVDGRERLNETTRRTVDFEAAESVGGFATLEYHWGDGDVVSASLRGGNPSGLYVAFEHRY